MTWARFFSFQGPKFLAIKEFWRKYYVAVLSLTVSSQALTSGNTTFGTKPTYAQNKTSGFHGKREGKYHFYLSTNIHG